ncbi:unnamed protein product [Linum trigynum]
MASASPVLGAGHLLLLAGSSSTEPGVKTAPLIRARSLLDGALDLSLASKKARVDLPDDSGDKMDDSVVEATSPNWSQQPR